MVCGYQPSTRATNANGQTIAEVGSALCTFRSLTIPVAQLTLPTVMRGGGGVSKKFLGAMGVLFWVQWGRGRGNLLAPAVMVTYDKIKNEL